MFINNILHFFISKHISTIHTHLFIIYHVHILITIYMYIYIYIFTNLLSTSIHGYQEKRKKKTSGTRDKNISNHRPGEKRKNIIGQKKEKANSVTPVKKNQEICSQLVKRKIKPTVKRCNATITRVLNMSGANYKINLNCKLEFSY